MSLDVYLTMPGAREKSDAPRTFIREHGQIQEISREEWDRRNPGREPFTVDSSETEEVYWANITHNLNRMAEAAGIYEACWQPEKIGATKAAQLAPLLRDGLANLYADPEKFKLLNPSNGWGDYDGFVRFVAEYLAACNANPEADVRASR